MPRFVGRTISEAAGGGWGCYGGLVDFRKKIYTCTLYILEVHIGKKRILHNSSVQKTFTYVQWAENKAAQDAPWVDSMNFISQLL